MRRISEVPAKARTASRRLCAVSSRWWTVAVTIQGARVDVGPVFRRAAKAAMSASFMSPRVRPRRPRLPLHAPLSNARDASAHGPHRRQGPRTDGPRHAARRDAADRAARLRGHEPAHAGRGDRRQGRLVLQPHRVEGVAAVQLPGQWQGPSVVIRLPEALLGRLPAAHGEIDSAAPCRSRCERPPRRHGRPSTSQPAKLTPTRSSPAACSTRRRPRG